MYIYYLRDILKYLIGVKFSLLLPTVIIVETVGITLTFSWLQLSNRKPTCKTNMRT